MPQLPGEPGAAGAGGTRDPAPGRDGEGRATAILTAYRATSAAVGLLGAAVCWYASRLVYYTPHGPGPAFFPLWLGLVLTALGFCLLIGSYLSRPDLTGQLSPPAGMRLQLLITLAAILGFTMLVERIGFVLTVFPMLTILLLARRLSLRLALAIAAVGSFGVGFVFMHYLGVSLPRAPRDLLLPIGL